MSVLTQLSYRQLFAFASPSDEVFGTGNDPINLKTNIEECSWGKATVVPGLGNVRYGNRAKAARAGLEKKVGGHVTHEAKAYAGHDLHIDAVGAEKRRFERCQKRHKSTTS